jgi:hypothetical protein
MRVEMASSPVHIVEIGASLEPSVCAYAASMIGRGMAAADFSVVLHPPWTRASPSGYALLDSERVVGTLLMISAPRTIRGRRRTVCNFSSWAIDPQYRSYSVSLLSRALRVPDAVYTNLTASAPVAKMLRAFGFQAVSDRERVLLPGIPSFRGPAFEATVDAAAIEGQLLARGAADVARLVADHRGTRAKWVSATDGARHVTVAFHLFRHRRIRFAHLLYCSNADALPAALGAIRRAVRRAWGRHLIAWSEYQVPGSGSSVVVRRPRPILYRGDDVGPEDLDGLYSELTLLPILK